MNTIRMMMNAIRPVIRARRAIFGPQRPTWNEELELIATVLRSGANPSVLLPLSWQRAITDPERPATPVVSATSRREITIPSEQAGVPGIESQVFEAPEADTTKTIIYLHGGGYSIGSLRSHRDLICRIAHACGVRVIAPAYRLAPEHPFPAQLDDALSVYAHVRAEGTPPENIAFAGESAGAGLSLSTAIALRDRGLPMPAAIVAVSPWVDLEGRGKSLDDNAAYDFVRRHALRQYARRFVRDEDLRNPLAAPLHADLRDLPPLLIHVGASEGLLDDGLHLAERARDAGVDVTLQVFPDMIHAFHVFAPMLPVAREAIADIGDFTRAHLAST